MGLRNLASFVIMLTITIEFVWSLRLISSSVFFRVYVRCMLILYLAGGRFNVKFILSKASQISLGVVPLKLES